MLEAKVQEAWRVLRIQSELVDGTDRLLEDRSGSNRVWWCAL